MRAGAYPPERLQRDAHALDELVEALQFLQQHHRRRADVKAELLAHLVEVKLCGQLAQHVLRYLVDVVVARDAAARVT